MFKLSAKLFAVLMVIAAFSLVCFQSFAAQPTLSATPNTQPLELSTLVATAPAPPRLVQSVLGGQPIYVLYSTRAEDSVLIRCYPGYEPTITVRAMGSNPSASVQKEGVMTCRSSS